MKALVTGASGFLGRCLVARLHADGVTVLSFVRPGSTAPDGTAEVCEGDLRDDEALRRAVDGVDVVIHAGARVSTTGTWEEFETTNVRATDALFAAAHAAGVRRIVHISSLAVYAVPADGVVVTEDSPFESAESERGFYARSKLAADRVATEWMGRGAAVVIVRPGLLYGPGRRPPLARRALALGPVRVIATHPDYRLPLAYVGNVADAVALAATVDRAIGRAYTVVDEHVRQREYERLYRRASGQRWVAVHLPPQLLVGAAAALETGARLLHRRSPVSRHQVARTVRSAVFSTERARIELGWDPRVSTEQALHEIFERQEVPGTASGGTAPSRA